jgi:outer membrane usher protein FimD/PapC
MFPELSTSALHFLYRILCVDPDQRADVFEALELLHRIDTIVPHTEAGMEDCGEDRSSSDLSASTSISTSQSSLAESSSMSLDGSYPRHHNGSQGDSMFHMEGDFDSKQMQYNWSLTSSGRSWSDMADEEEMDFSRPIGFEESTSVSSTPADSFSMAGFTKLSDLLVVR